MRVRVPLAHARLWRRLSLEQVARLTGGTVADIVAIERGDFPLSPGTDVPTMLRAYANAVGLDPDTVVRNYSPPPSAEPAQRDVSTEPERDDAVRTQSATSKSDGLSQFRSERRREPPPERIASAEHTVRATDQRKAARPKPAIEPRIVSTGSWRPAVSDRAKRLSIAGAIAAVAALSVYGPFDKVSRPEQKADARTGTDVALQVGHEMVPDKPSARPQMVPEAKSEVSASPAVVARDTHNGAVAGNEELNGWWAMTNQVQSSTYAAYRRLRLGYRLQLEQHGNRVSGHGQKWSENGRRIAGVTRTPITVDGEIQGRHVALTFVEHGHRRTSAGRFELTLTSTGRLAGTFESDAAQSRGSSIASRLSANVLRE